MDATPKHYLIALVGVVVILFSLTWRSIRSSAPTSTATQTPPSPMIEPELDDRLHSSDYGSRWPFPEFDTAKIDCKIRRAGNRPLVIIQLGSTWYGLNGAAMGVGGYPDARKKMVRHPEFGGYQLGATSDLIGMGLAICGR